MKKLSLAGLSFLTLASAAHAAPVPLPLSFFVDATSPAGTTLTFTNVSGTDTLAFIVSGSPTLQTMGQYGVNAAGVVTIAGSSVVGGSSVDPLSGFTYGALILTLNGANATQAFATSAANGLGSSTPPTTLSFSNSLQNIFGVGPGPIASAVLNFKLDDTLFTDNAGGFTIRAAAGAVPEPASWAMMIGGFGVAGGVLRVRRRASVRLA